MTLVPNEPEEAPGATGGPGTAGGTAGGGKAAAAAAAAAAERTLEPPHLCGLIGLVGSAAIVSHAALFTLPEWDTVVLDSVAAHGGTARIIGASYGGKTLTDFCHGWAYFHLMGRLGATSMSVLKALVAAASFFSSVTFFCNRRCCVPSEQALHGNVCPLARAGASAGTSAAVHGGLSRPSFFCHYSPSQCFTPHKAVSLALVLSGVLLYTASSRQRLQQPAEEVEEESDEELDEAQVASQSVTSEQIVASSRYLVLGTQHSVVGTEYSVLSHPGGLRGTSHGDQRGAGAAGDAGRRRRRLHAIKRARRA